MVDEATGSSNAPAPRKMRFKPKAPPIRASGLVMPKTEVPESAEAADAALHSELLKLVQKSKEDSVRPKFEKKVAPVQVAFGYGDTLASMRPSRVSRSGINNGLPGNQGGFIYDGANTAAQGMEKEYIEPWDYYSYYPVTLPLRRPYSGKPELLDEEEFKETSLDLDQEDSLNSALELSLLEEKEDAQLLFFQLPASFPLAKRSAVAKDSNSNPSQGRDRPEEACRLKELPAGFVGKMLVYESGIVKMKLGDTLFDVNPGSDCLFAQDAVVINTEQKQCCILGEISKRAIVAPDLNTILDGNLNIN